MLVSRNGGYLPIICWILERNNSWKNQPGKKEQFARPEMCDTFNLWMLCHLCKKVIFPVLFPMTANQFFLLIWIWKNQWVCKTITFTNCLWLHLASKLFLYRLFLPAAWVGFMWNLKPVCRWRKNGSGKKLPEKNTLKKPTNTRGQVASAHLLPIPWGIKHLQDLIPDRKKCLPQLGFQSSNCGRIHHC